VLCPCGGAVGGNIVSGAGGHWFALSQRGALICCDEALACELADDLIRD